MSNKKKIVASILYLLARDKSLDQIAIDLDLQKSDIQQTLMKIAQQYSPEITAGVAPSNKPDQAITTSTAVAFIDGGARGNPGPAGCGTAIFSSDGELLAEKKKFLGKATNNVAEYQGLLLALSTCEKLQIKRIEIRADSKLLVEQMCGRYKVKSPLLAPLFKKAQILAKNFENVVYTHVRREKNKDADRLANMAMDEGT